MGQSQGGAGSPASDRLSLPTATGLLKDKVNLERDDSDLELTALTYDLSANYSCTVTADDGTKASARDEILIVGESSQLSMSASGNKPHFIF